MTSKEKFSTLYSSTKGSEICYCKMEINATAEITLTTLLKSNNLNIINSTSTMSMTTILNTSITTLQYLQPTIELTTHSPKSNLYSTLLIKPNPYPIIFTNSNISKTVSISNSNLTSNSYSTKTTYVSSISTTTNISTYSNTKNSSPSSTSTLITNLSLTTQTSRLILNSVKTNFDQAILINPDNIKLANTTLYKSASHHLNSAMTTSTSSITTKSTTQLQPLIFLNNNHKTTLLQSNSTTISYSNTLNSTSSSSTITTSSTIPTSTTMTTIKTSMDYEIKKNLSIELKSAIFNFYKNISASNCINFYLVIVNNSCTGISIFKNMVIYPAGCVYVGNILSIGIPKNSHIVFYNISFQLVFQTNYFEVAKLDFEIDIELETSCINIEPKNMDIILLSIIKQRNNSNYYYHFNDIYLTIATNCTEGIKNTSNCNFIPGMLRQNLEISNYLDKDFFFSVTRTQTSIYLNGIYLKSNNLSNSDDKFIPLSVNDFL